MTFLLAVQVLFTLSTILLLFGIAGVMITNKQDDRWLVAIATGAIGFFILGGTWWIVESKAPCCRCPAEQVGKP
jgi:hypothetical protein